MKASINKSSFSLSSALCTEANWAKNGEFEESPGSLGFIRLKERALDWSLKVRIALMVPSSITPNEILSNFRAF